MKGKDRLRALMILLCVIGVIFSTLLVVHQTATTFGIKLGSSYCHINSTFDCDAVARSDYATIVGIPVASLGLVFYLSLFGVCWLYLPKGENSSAGGLASALAVTTAVALVPTIALLVISAVSIKVFCPYCLVLDLVNVGLVLATIKLAREYNGGRVGWGAGVAAILRFLFAPLPSSDFGNAARVGWFAMLFLFISVICAPGFAVFSWVLRENEQARVQIVDRSFATWQSAEVEEILIIDSADPEQKDYSLGPKDAAVTLIEFTDFECPVCKAMAPRVDDLRKKYPQMRFVLKSYPLDQACNPIVSRPMHEHACEAARMARCAGMQGDKAFWEMAEALFELSPLEPAGLKALGAKLGLDQNKLDTCLQDSKASDRVAKDIELGTALHLEGTPSFFINGKRVGEPDPTLLAKILESIQKSR